MIQYGRVEPYQKEEDVYKTGLYIRGHANYVTKGDDIVCAAVSAIGQAAIAGCEAFDAYIEIKQRRKGHIVFVCEHTTETNAIIQAAILGLDGIKAKYPQCFKLDK